MHPIAIYMFLLKKYPGGIPVIECIAPPAVFPTKVKFNGIVCRYHADIAYLNVVGPYQRKREKHGKCNNDLFHCMQFIVRLI